MIGVNGFLRNEITLKISSCIETIATKTSPEMKKKFRSRARDIAPDIFSKGLAYVLIYTAARSSARLVEKGLLVADCETMIKEIDGERIKDEEKGYAVYGALLLFILKEMNILRSKTFSEAIKSVLNDPTIEIYASKAAEWIKRFAEAYIEEE